MITFNFEEGCYQDNYENITANSIDEREEILETEESLDDSDSGIDSLYECIKFKTSGSFHDPGLTLTCHISCSKSMFIAPGSLRIVGPVPLRVSHRVSLLSPNPLPPIRCLGNVKTRAVAIRSELFTSLRHLFVVYGPLFPVPTKSLVSLAGGAQHLSVTTPVFQTSPSPRPGPWSP